MIDILEKEQLSAQELKQLIISNTEYELIILDVRSALEYERYHIPDAINISISDLSLQHLKSVINYDSNKKYIVVTYCNAGGRGGRSFHLLKNENNNQNIMVKNLTNGINEWIRERFFIIENI